MRVINWSSSLLMFLYWLAWESRFTSSELSTLECSCWINVTMLPSSYSTSVMTPFWFTISYLVSKVPNSLSNVLDLLPLSLLCRSYSIHFCTNANPSFSTNEVDSDVDLFCPLLSSSSSSVVLYRESRFCSLFFKRLK